MFWSRLCFSVHRQFMELEVKSVLVNLTTFESGDQEICHCRATQNELSLKETVRKQAVTIYIATHLTRHLSKQKVLNPALACLSVPDIWLMTVWPLQQRKTADEKSESLQALPAPTATCVLTCKILSLYVPPTYPHLPLLLRAHSCRQGKTSPSPCQSPAGGPRVLR